MTAREFLKDHQTVRAWDTSAKSRAERLFRATGQDTGLYQSLPEREQYDEHRVMRRPDGSCYHVTYTSGRWGGVYATPGELQYKGECAEDFGPYEPEWAGWSVDEIKEVTRTEATAKREEARADERWEDVETLRTVVGPLWAADREDAIRTLLVVRAVPTNASLEAEGVALVGALLDPPADEEA